MATRNLNFTKAYERRALTQIEQEEIEFAVEGMGRPCGGPTCPREIAKNISCRRNECEVYAEWFRDLWHRLQIDMGEMSPNE